LFETRSLFRDSQPSIIVHILCVYRSQSWVFDPILPTGSLHILCEFGPLVAYHDGYWDEMCPLSRSRPHKPLNTHIVYEQEVQTFENPTIFIEYNFYPKSQVFYPFFWFIKFTIFIENSLNIGRLIDIILYICPGLHFNTWFF
jgi:hypothetical protein